MSAAKTPLVIEQGVTFDRTVTVKLSTGAVRDLTGYSARMKVREHPSSTAALLSLTSPVVSGQGIDVGGANGQLVIKIPAANTAALDFWNVFYDLEIVAPTGEVTRVLEGKCSLSREVTK